MKTLPDPDSGTARYAMLGGNRTAHCVKRAVKVYCAILRRHLSGERVIGVDKITCWFFKLSTRTNCPCDNIQNRIRTAVRYLLVSLL